ncbi:MAG: hypothetical protein WD672_07465 [Woeseia sp.]
MRLAFDIEDHKRAFTIFEDEIQALNKEINDAEPGSDTPRHLRKVCRHILEYQPITKADEDALAEYQTLVKRVKVRRGEECARITTFQLFHRAIFDVWTAMINRAMECEVSLSASVDATVCLVDESLQSKGSFFDFSKRYMQETVFQGHRIKAKEATRVALAHLILSHLGNPAVAAAVAKSLISDDTNELAKELEEFGLDEAQHLGVYLQKEKRRAFVNSYKVDLTLSTDERDELAAAEAKEIEQEAERRAGKREDTEKPFSELVSEYVREDTIEVLDLLKQELGLTVDIRISGYDDSDVEESEEGI